MTVYVCGALCRVTSDDAGANDAVARKILRVFETNKAHGYPQPLPVDVRIHTDDADVNYLVDHAVVH